MADPVAERIRRRDALLAAARDYVDRLSRRAPVVAAAVVGSVARGDFNVWSDVDVVVVADDLPARIPDRGLVLAADARMGVQAVGFTPREFERAHRRGDPLAREATTSGVVLRGEGYLRRFH